MEKGPLLNSFMQLLARFGSFQVVETEGLSSSLAVGRRLPSLPCHTDLSIGQPMTWWLAVCLPVRMGQYQTS